VTDATAVAVGVADHNITQADIIPLRRYSTPYTNQHSHPNPIIRLEQVMNSRSNSSSPTLGRGHAGDYNIVFAHSTQVVGI
jgi:antitoxin (DNA-binding transcriptional repressor) of toxin-antitoxin stability system